MRGYHFLRTDWTAGSGNEPAWTVGETRTLDHPERIGLCDYGYHYSPSWLDALGYAPGPVACVVEVEPVETDEKPYQRKGVSASRTLVVGRDCSRELRLFAADCAERALLREREAGSEPDPRLWAGVEAARQHARGEINDIRLAAVWAAARAAAWAADSAADSAAVWAAAWAAAWAADSAAVWAAARAADSAAAWAAEREWQAERLAWYLDTALRG